jgi:hypothetical protein
MISFATNSWLEFDLMNLFSVIVQQFNWIKSNQEKKKNKEQVTKSAICTM